MTVRCLMTLCALVLAGGPATADWVSMEISENQADADHPALAVSPDGSAVIAWEEAGVGVWTRFVDAFVVGAIVEQPPEFQGSGHRPVVVWTWRGFLLVWADGQDLRYRYGGESGWGDPSQVIPAGLEIADAQLDLQGCAEPGWNVGWLGLTVPDGFGMDHWFVRLHKGGFDPPELLAEGLTEWAGVQVAQVPHALQPVPRVYYFSEFTHLACRTGLFEGGWEAESMLPGEYYGAACDARGHADGRQAVLSLGPQPTCPCNTIHYSEQDDGGNWSAPVTLMTEHDAFDWPQSPQVAWGAGDEVHAFWVQFTSNDWMEPGRTHLEYRRRVGGVWQDRSAVLADQERRSLGWHVAMELTAQGEPLFAWTRQDTLESGPQPRRVWLARPQSVVGAPASGVGGLELAAWPNPGRTRIAVAGSAPQGEAATLVVYDLAGRRVATPVMSAAAPGRFGATWDGRDAAGREAPAGIYLMRLSAAGGTVTRRVVLAR